MGGMDGFGKVVREENEPVFHADWERRMYALVGLAMGAARVLADKPLASLIECKRVIAASSRGPIADARARENEAFRRLMGQPANVEALTAFAERRSPDFVAIDARHPVDVADHR